MTPEESISDALFGARYRLRVAAVVAAAEPGVVFAKQVAEEADVAGNVVGKELKRFARAGLLIQLNASQGGGIRVMYERVDSSFWGLILSLLEEVHDRQGVSDR